MLCRFPSPHPRGKLRGLVWGVSRPTPGGGVSQHALRQTLPPPTMAIAAGGTHPTGMHSCLRKSFADDFMKIKGLNQEGECPSLVAPLDPSMVFDQ